MEIVLDVSELEPCEPLERTLAATQTLPDGDYLRVIFRREPHPLFPLLDKAGFDSCCRPGEASQFEVFVWRQRDQAADQQVKLLF